MAESLMREQEHNYEIKSLPMGFEILPKDMNRPVLQVIANSHGFWEFSDDVKGWEALPLYCFYPLVSSSVNKLYESWNNPRENQTPGHVLRWMTTQTAKCLNRRILNEWQRVTNSFDPTLQKVHKRFFSLACGKGYWENVKAILKENNPYIVSDILSYKSAAVAILFDSTEKWKQDWAFSFAKDDIKYHSLMRTLMNVPNGIIYGMMPNLKNFYLPEPTFTPIRMMAYTCLPDTRYNSQVPELMKVILRSTDEDIRKGIRLMWHYFPSTVSSGFRSKREIVRALMLIYDYTGSIGKWDISGLAKRSEQWHHDLALQQRMRDEEQERQRLEDNKAYAEKMKKLKAANTMLPNIPLPANEHIRFLDTYASVLDEGVLMNHCIAQYAERAVDGASYLFHVDYNGEMASVEVNPKGYVIQSYGPRDKINSASKYGSLILNRWSKALQDKKNPPVIKRYGNIAMDLENGADTEIPF
jgi:hypothetical protein